MRKSRAAVVAATAAALVGGTLLAAPAAGAADDTTRPVVTSVDIRPETVVLYAGDPTKVVVDVKATDDVGVTEAWIALLSARDENADEQFPLELVSGTPQDGTWRVELTADKTQLTGLYAAAALVFDAANNENVADSPYDEFYVKRNTVIKDFNVAEPATKGTYLKMAGRLVRLDPAKGYVGYGGKTMEVWFRAAGAKSYVKVGSVTTTSTGSFANSRKFLAKADGAWRVRFAGTSNYHGETSTGDYVDVR